MRCGQGWGKTAIASPRRVAEGLADHLNRVLNRTVTDGRLSLVSDPADERTYTLACLTPTESGSFALHGTMRRLLVLQRLHVVGKHCETLSYQYRLSRGKDKATWLIRWEYLRRRPTPDYAYPLAHLHVNGEFAGRTLSLRKLHVPTARIPLELVLWHLIAEWGVEPKRKSWQQILQESIEGFETRRQAR